jgi:hypothetical protein
MDTITNTPRHDCHNPSAGEPSVFTISVGEWRSPDKNRPYRSCDYCGSIHPADAMSMMADPTTRMEVADWKYGWPHKVYLSGAVTGRTGMAKFYPIHLQDTHNDPTVVAALCLRLQQTTGIEYVVRPEGLGWRRTGD